MTKPQNIKVVEGNAFALLFPLIARTYTQNGMPSDEDIDLTRLSNVVVKVGGVEYENSIETGGVQILIPGTLAKGTYNIELTADYEGSDIRASYFEALTIVSHSYQSDAEQYIQGSPVALAPAYVIGGALTDAELEALKAELRLKIAAAERAKEAADAAKEQYDTMAEQLSDVAQQTTLTQGVADIRDDISHIDIDTSALAKQGSNANATLSDTQAAVKDGNDTSVSVSKDVRSEVGTGSDTAAETGTLFAVVKWVKDKVKSIYNLIGTPASGQPSTLFAAIAAGGGDYPAIDAELAAGKAAIVDAINAQGGEASAQQSLGELAQEVGELNTLDNTIVFLPTVQRPIDLVNYHTSGAGYNKINIVEVHDNKIYSISARESFSACSNLKFLDFPEVTGNIAERLCQNCNNVQKIYVPKATGFNQYAFLNCGNLIDLKFGALLAGNINLSGSISYNPTNAMNLTNSLCFDTDLQDYGRTFSNNREKWNFCLREHFAALLQDRTGETAYTITFGSAILDNMEAETIAAFTNKNWTLA